MFKGLKNLGPEAIAQEVMKIGGQLNAYTTHDATKLSHEDVAAQNFDGILAHEASAFSTSSFESMLESEREVVKEERRDADRQLAHCILYRGACAAYSAQSSPAGGRPLDKDLDKIELLKDCQDFFNTHYNPKNVTVLIVGAIDHETAFKESSTTLGRAVKNSLARSRRRR